MSTVIEVYVTTTLQRRLEGAALRVCCSKQTVRTVLPSKLADLGERIMRKIDNEFE